MALEVKGVLVPEVDKHTPTAAAEMKPRNDRESGYKAR